MSKKDKEPDNVTDIKENEPTVLNAAEAQYLLAKLDTPSVIPINGHKDRINMNTICNTLMQIIKEKAN